LAPFLYDGDQDPFGYPNGARRFPSRIQDLFARQKSSCLYFLLQPDAREGFFVTVNICFFLQDFCVVLPLFKVFVGSSNEFPSTIGRSTCQRSSPSSISD